MVPANVPQWVGCPSRKTLLLTFQASGLTADRLQFIFPNAILPSTGTLYLMTLIHWKPDHYCPYFYSKLKTFFLW